MSTTPSHATQTLEAANRDAIAQQSMVPAATAAEMAAAMDVVGVDDAPAENDFGQRQPQPVDAKTDEPPKLPTPRKDSKRDDIAARFRQERNTEIEDADDISDFARSGMPREFEAPEPEQAEEVIEAEAQAEAQVQPEAEQKPQKRKLKIRGEEREFTDEEITAAAMKSLAAEDYLTEARGKLDQVDELLRDTRNRAQHPGQHGTHPAEQNVVQPGEAQVDPAVDPQHQEEDLLGKAVELLQYGDPNEAKALLDRAVEQRATQAASRAVQSSLQTQKVQDEDTRSIRELEGFRAQHQEIAQDPFASAAVERAVYELQVEDLKSVGIQPNQLRTRVPGAPTKDEISQAHRELRIQGFQVRRPSELLAKAVQDYNIWRGVSKADVQPTDPNPQPEPQPQQQPRVQVRVERDQRRQAIPQQPSRSAAPRPLSTQPSTPPSRDRSSVVQGMKARRGLPRGQITA